MSNETTNPVVKWILIGVIVVSFCFVGALFLIGSYPTEEYRAVNELEKRGFEIVILEDGYISWQYPIQVWGYDRSVTEDDSRLICQIHDLAALIFRRCDLSRLNLDNIGNCQRLTIIEFDDVTQLSDDEIRKLAACPGNAFAFTNLHWNDSNLANFAKWTTADYLVLENNAEITDAGFEHLEKIASLRHLCLAGTSVTQKGVDDFRKKRPDVYVEF